MPSEEKERIEHAVSTIFISHIVPGDLYCHNIMESCLGTTPEATWLYPATSNYVHLWVSKWQ